jgi:hypothetical protein
LGNILYRLYHAPSNTVVALILANGYVDDAQGTVVPTISHGTYGFAARLGGPCMGDHEGQAAGHGCANIGHVVKARGHQASRSLGCVLQNLKQNIRVLARHDRQQGNRTTERRGGCRHARLL